MWSYSPEIQHVEFSAPAPLDTDSSIISAPAPIRVVGFTPRVKAKELALSSIPSPHFPKSLKAVPTTQQNLLSVYSVAHNITDQLEFPSHSTQKSVSSVVVPTTSNVSPGHNLKNNKTFLDPSRSVICASKSSIPINFNLHHEWTEERWTRHVKRIPPSPAKELDQLERAIEEIEWMTWLNQRGYRKYYSHPTWVKDNPRKTWVSMMINNKKKA